MRLADLVNDDLHKTKFYDRELKESIDICHASEKYFSSIFFFREIGNTSDAHIPMFKRDIKPS